MKKSKYGERGTIAGKGKLSIIIILIATLIVSAAIAIFGLSTQDITGANDLSASISAPEKDASSAIMGGEETADGTIEAPEIETQAAATYTSFSSWSTAVATSGNTLQITSSQLIYSNHYTVPAGITLNLYVSSSTTLNCGGIDFIVNGTLIIYGGGTISCLGVGNSFFTVNSGGSLYFGSTSNGSPITVKYSNTSAIAGDGGCVNVKSGGSFRIVGTSSISGFISEGNGGGVYNAGTFSLTGAANAANITSCKAANGGGVYNASTGTFTFSTNGIIVNNQASSCGGGVYNKSGKFTFSAGSISGNNAPQGGGVYQYGGTFTMNSASAIVTSNRAVTVAGDSTSGRGGGVYLYSGTFTFTAGYIRSNTAVRGGGVFYYMGTFNMDGGIIGGGSNYGNTATEYGGGVYVDYNFAPTSGTISYNTCSGSSGYGGGGVYVSSFYTFTTNYEVLISQNTAPNGYGGGVYNKGTLDMSKNGRIEYCSAIYGGGVCSSGTFNMDTTESKATNINYCDAMYGGGVCLTGGTFTQTYGFICRNTATDGAGIYILSGTYNLNGGLLGYYMGSSSGNTAERNGGGAYIYGGTINIDGGGVMYNNASGNGGGLCQVGGTVNLKQTDTSSNSYFIYNSATGETSYGGAAYITNASSVFNISGGYSHSNTAAYGGGFAVMSLGTLNISGGSVGYYTTSGNSTTTIGNTATVLGGGVFLGNGIVEMTGGNIYYNKVENSSGKLTGSGGGVAVGAGTFKISSSSAVISYNSALNGGGVSASGGSIVMSAGYIRNNTADTYGGGVHLSSIGAITQTGGNISYNSATSGGGIYIDSTGKSTLYQVGNNSASGNGGGVYLVNGEVTQNYVIGYNSATSGKGGGVYMSGGTYTLSSGSYIGLSGGNSAMNGGGVYMTGGTFNNSGYIYTNTASSMGGGVYMTSGTFNLTGGAIGGSGTTYANTATLYGGGVYMSGGTFEMSGSSYIRYNSATYGGGVSAVGGTFNLKGGTIRNNTAKNYGGGVRLAGATFNLTGGYIGISGYSNTAPLGGGVYVESGTFNMSGGYVTYNTAGAVEGSTSAVDYCGGGLYVRAGTANLSGGSIYGNAADDGAGIYQYNGTLKLSATYIGSSSSHNVASGNGGGIFVNMGTFTMTGGYIRYNEATNGAGIWFESTTEATISNGSIFGNEATENGGGIYHRAYANLTLSGTASIYSNTAVNGGGVYAAYERGCKFIMAGGTIRNNTASGNGGGVYVSNSGEFEMTDGTIGLTSTSYANTAKNGGGLYVDDAATTTISGGKIVYNTATEYGGGAYVFGTLTLDNTGSVESNTAQYGGGVYIANGTFNMDGGTITKNKASISSTEAGYGGGVFVAGGKLNMTGGTIGGTSTTYANTAKDGGGLYVRTGTANLSGGNISYNSATEGGGIYQAPIISVVNLSGVSVTYNRATTGAGVAVYGAGSTTMGMTATLEMTGGTIANNTASTIGGGLYVSNNTATVTFTGGTITANNATTNGAGVYVNSSATFNMSGTAEISGNTATVNGGGVYIQNGTFAMTAGSISGNLAKSALGSGVYVAGATLKLGGTAYIYDNMLHTAQNNVYAEAESVVTFSGKLATGAKIGVTGINTEDFVLTSGFTTAGHSQTDIDNFFVADTRGLVLKYLNNEIVIRYDLILAWNETVQASLDNNSQETFILYYDWTAENGGFDEGRGGVGFYGTGLIYVPANADVIFDLNGHTVDADGTYGGIFRVDGSLEITAYAATTSFVKGGNNQNGGAVYVNGGNFTFSGGTISNNTASYGGAVYVDNGGYFLMNRNNSYSYIQNNEAESGGGVYVADGTFELTGGYIGYLNSGNVANSYGGGVYVASTGVFTLGAAYVRYNEALSGGGVYVAGGKFEMTDGAIGGRGGGNVATENGGGLYVDSGNVTIEGVFVFNEAENGGGLYIAGGTVKISSYADIYYNTAVDGAGLYIAGGNVTVEDDVMIDENTATGNGGGVYVTGNSTQLTLSDDSEVTDNAAVNGLGIYINGGTVTVTDDARIYTNNNTTDTTTYGGGVYIANGELNMQGGRIFRNTVTDGAGVYVAGGEFRLSDGDIYANTATGNGGGVYVGENGTFSMTGGTIGGIVTLFANNAVSGAGVYTEGLTSITGGTISHNIASDYGGGVVVWGGTFTLGGTAVISGNTADKSGGGVDVENGSFIMNGGEISSNASPFGAGVCIIEEETEYTSSFVMNGGEIKNNVSSQNAGGVYVNKGSFEMTDGVISGNSATLSGGGVFVDNNGSFTMNGGEISGNTAATGAGVYIQSGAFELKDGEITGNTATTSGGGVYFVNSTFEMSGGTIGANQALTGAGVFVSGGGRTFEMSGGSVSSNTATGSGNLGGGVYVAANSYLNMSGEAEITGNSANLGGGVYLNSGATLNLTAGSINNNTAASGGGVYIQGGTLEMTGGEISENNATDANVGYGGGGVFVLNGEVNVSGTAKINDNAAARYGGGIRIDGTSDSSSVEIQAGTLSDNSATIGGAVYAAGNFASLTIAGTTTVSGNEASTSGGGIALAEGAKATLSDNAYITGNEASLNGGGVYVTGSGSTLTVTDKGAITYNTASYGGGAYLTASGKLILEDGSISCNEASTYGGAVYISAGTLEVNGGKLFGNTAVNGGAVYVAASANSTFTMTGGTIGGEDLTDSGENQAANRAEVGAGLYVAGGSVTLSGGEIVYNEAANNAGGVYYNAGTLSLSGNPVIEFNVVQGSASNLYLYNNKTVSVIGELTAGAHIGVTVTGQVTVGYQTSGNGEPQKDYFFGDITGSIVSLTNGEIWIQISLEDAWNAAVESSLNKGGAPVTFVLAETWRAKNGAFGDDAGAGFTNGGALYLPQGAYIVLNLNSYTINRDLTTATGSVFYIAGSLEISGNSGTITGGYAENGGGIYVEDGGYLKLSIGYIYNNAATNGGGVYLESGARFEMTDGAIRGNSASDGGAVYVEDGAEFTMTGGTIGGANYANGAMNGAGIYTAGSVTITGGSVTANVGDGVYVEGGEFNLNGATATISNNGLGIVVGDGTVEIANGTISGNVGAYGGGVCLAGGKLTISGGVITGNTANGIGGGVYSDGGEIEMTGGEISGNTENVVGAGGIYIENAAFSMNGGKIINNTGCGVYVGENGSFTLTDGTISGNEQSLGGGVSVLSGSFVMNGGEISGNSATDGGGVCVQQGTFEMTNGKITGNTATSGAGVYVQEGTFEMTGGEISLNEGASDNTSADGGGVYVYTGGSFTLTDGDITGNTAYNGAGVSVTGGTFVMNGGKISDNNAENAGGGVDVMADVDNLVDAEVTINGGEISGNTSEAYGGGIMVFHSTLIMNNGTISGNSSANGGGVYVYADSSFTLNGGEISGNSAETYGGGICGTSADNFTITGGTISGNTADIGGGGIYVSNGTLRMTGGTVTGNTAMQGAGVYVTSSATFEIEGSPMIYGNTNVDGLENNVYLATGKVLTVTGMLSINGLIAYIGVTMADPSKKKFTSGFATNNSQVLPQTIFFSDNTDYMVSMEDNEAVLVENDYSQTSLQWQISKDGGNWINIESPYVAIRFVQGESYAIRAVDASGDPVNFDIATDGTADINASNFSGIGSYKFVINEESYLNPALTVEIIPAKLVWQYSTDEGRTWLDLTVDTLVYTGAEYKVRAVVYDKNFDPDNPVQLFNDTMHDVGSYSFTVDDVDSYENPTLNFTITTRYVTVEWNFGDALGDGTNGYYWEYDGNVHAPVAVLNGVSNELAGADLTLGYNLSDGSGISYAPYEAGEYTLTVTLKDAAHADPNVVLSNNTVKFAIERATLSLVWVDEEGNEGDEFTFAYNNEEHGVDFVLSGVVAGDETGASVVYTNRSGKVLSGAPTAVGYYTATVKLPDDCKNYVFDKTYICQIVITQQKIAVEWQPNSDGTFVWTFNGKGQGPTATLINPYTGEELQETFKVEYAPVASNGNIGTYSDNHTDAGNYIVKLTLTNADANYALDEESATRLFTIAKLGVTIEWKGATYDADKNVYFWYYDGDEHDLEAEVSLVGKVIEKDGVTIDKLEVKRVGTPVKLVDVGSATATVELDVLNDPFNANFYFLNSASQVYEVRKAVIDPAAVVWTDKLGQPFGADDNPEYDFGTITGVNGPAFEATAFNGTVILEVTYNKTYTGDWVVDETVGYIAYAKLSATDAANYEFKDGAEYATLTFFINSVGGIKQDIEITWVVFLTETYYETLDQYLAGDGFIYNGEVQYPTPMRVNDDGSLSKLGDNVFDYLNANSVGADAGKYTARLKPSSVYNIKEEQFTCEYEIKKLDVEISWRDGESGTSGTTYSYNYTGSEQAPYAYVSSTLPDGMTVEITVTGAKTNAGNYVATAAVGSNFNITSGKTRTYSINKHGLTAGLIEWNFADQGASGNDTDGWYWEFDGSDHAPTAVIPASNWGGSFDIVLTVTGATSEIGTHTAYAILDGGNTVHNNFYLTGTASVTFEIVQVQAGKIYWGEEDAEGNVTFYTGDIVFTYDGTEHMPNAYYLDDNGDPVKVEVKVIGGTAVNAGTYTAYVSSDLDFDSALPTCTFKIEAMEITVEWDDTATFTYNGEEQAPTVTLSKGADNYELVEGTDYEIVGFTDAGEHTAQIKFLNKNYTCADTDKEFVFTIGKVELGEIDGTNVTEGFAWKTDGYDTDTDSYFWTADGDEHHPELTVTYTVNGVNVDFEIGYYGVASSVGTHKVTAYIKSATVTVDGVDIDVTDNFSIEAEMAYEIKPVSVTVDWDWDGFEQGVDENGETYYYVNYNGENNAPKAYLLDADGNRILNDDGTELELEVLGAEKNARDDMPYTATAIIPDGYTVSGDKTAEYFVKKAQIEVNWEYTGNVTEKVDANGDTYYEWTYGEEVEFKAYIKVTLDDGTVTNGAELDLTELETDKGNHTLTVMQNNGNYEFATATEGAISYVINPKEVYVIWYGADGTDDDAAANFEWTFDSEKQIAPEAYLAEKDANGDLQLILDADGNKIKVEVSGASNEIGKHTAQVVNTFFNYVFAADVEAKEFTIKSQDLADSGFGWTADGVEPEQTADGLKFTYEYGDTVDLKTGESKLPVPSSDVEDLEFKTTIYKVNDDGSEEIVLSITEVGTYKITVSSTDKNYSIPDGYETIIVEVTARTVEVIWDDTELVYNGNNQTPKAYYENVEGNKVELDVEVDGDSKKVGTTYTAKATLGTNDNYVLDTATATYEFEITAKTIAAVWGDNEFTYNGTAQACLPQIKLTSDMMGDISKIVYEITDKDGNVVAGTNETDKKVTAAGEYTVKVKLEGTGAGNYEIDVDEYTFTIGKAELSITVGDKELNYGESLELSMDDVTVTGWQTAEDEEAIKADLEAALKQWLYCEYNKTSEPGEYDIEVISSWINKYILANYEVTEVETGTLTVKSVPYALVWKADGVNDDNELIFTYDGETNLPRAYYYDANNVKHELTVSLATMNADGTYTPVTDGEAKAVGTYYAVVVGDDGNVLEGILGYEFENNSGIKFNVVKRSIVITVDEEALNKIYGFEADADLEEILKAAMSLGDVKPLDGDELDIKLVLDGEGVNGFLNADTYTLTLSWNSDDFGDRYEVTIKDNLELTFTVEKATPKVNLDKDGDFYLNDYVILKNGEFACDFLKTPENFIEIAGWQDEEITVRFSEAYVKGSEPSLEGFEFSNDTPAQITEAGYYVFLFKITLPNHEEVTGKLLVKAVDEDNVLYVTVKNNVEESYGYEVTADLAQKLFADNYYAAYDEDISPLDKATFLSYITAKVVDADENEVTGKLPVGTYKVIFGLTDEAPDKYSVHVNDSNHVYIVITKGVIEIDWGDENNLNYTYDGETHMPVITVKGLTDGNGNPVTLGIGENLITINGETVKVVVTVDGDFTAAGAHSVHVSVEDDNFLIDEENALCSVSITEPASPAPVQGVGLKDWQLALIIAAAILLLLIIIILIIVLVKRRAVGDDDGFYDDVDESDLA